MEWNIVLNDTPKVMTVPMYGIAHLKLAPMHAVAKCADGTMASILAVASVKCMHSLSPKYIYICMRLPDLNFHVMLHYTCSINIKLASNTFAI